MTPVASPAHLTIEFAQASDPGRDPNKQVNEDSCGYAETPLGHLCVLCDGMGGHYGGKEASRLAIATIFELMERAQPGAPPAATLKAAIEEGGRRVYLLGGPPENRTRPGSTVVAMILHERGADVAHVGDSRAYAIRSGQIYPLTRDHSMVQGMIDAGMLTEEGAIGHPDANKITRALGMKPDVEVDVRPEPMELFPGDMLLLTSDGLTDLALGADILACMQHALATGSVQTACDQLVQLANDRGGHDNITVQLVRIVSVGPKPLTIPQAPAQPHQAPMVAAHAAPPSQSGMGLAVHALEPPPSQRPQETLAMTEHDGGAATGVAHPMAGDAARVSASGPAPLWPPVSPTTPGAPLAAAAVGPGAPPSRTLPEGVPPSARPWPPGNFPPPGAAPAVGYGATTGQHAPLAPQPGYFGAPQPPPLPSGISASDARPSSGGLVFLIIGASAVIAVLLVILIWAFFLQ